MSRKDERERFDHQWERHQRWLNGTLSGKRSKGKYVEPDPNSTFKLTVNLDELEPEIQKYVRGHVEEVVAALVLVGHARQRRDLIVAELAEAERTKTEMSSALADLDMALALQPTKPNPTPSDVVGDVKRLGSALATIGEPPSIAEPAPEPEEAVPV